MKKLFNICVIILLASFLLSACSDSVMEEFDELKTENDGMLGGGDMEPPLPD